MERMNWRRWVVGVVALVLAPLAGCAAARAASSVNPSTYDHTVKVACVGDSITYGAGVADRATGTYPVQLGKMLGKQWEVKNFGVNGATLLHDGDKPYDKQKAYHEALAWKPDVVVIMLGTNDSKPQNWAHKGEFISDYEKLIGAFKEANPQARVYAVLPVPAFPGRWGIRESVIQSEVLPAVEKVAAAEQAAVIDLHKPLEEKKALFRDTVHPNAEGSGIMAAYVAHALTGEAAGKYEAQGQGK